MKNILILFICIILCGCSYPPLQEPSPTQSPPQIFTPTSWSIGISCWENNTQNMITKIEQYSGVINTVEIVFMGDCVSTKIPWKILDTLVKKPMNAVHILSIPNEQQKYYLLDDSEVRVLAKGLWKWLWIDWNMLNKTQYKILRNEKPAVREWFEPNGDPDIYSEAERKKCGWKLDEYMKNSTWGVEDESVFQYLLDETVKCYKDLPPIP